MAIIAILAAIAVPNLLEAQTRAKVARTKADLRTTAVALESYATDSNAYPPNLQLLPLSTPVAYLTSSAVPDVFANPKGSPLIGYLEARAASEVSFLESFHVTGTTEDERAELASHRFIIFSNGPDRIDEALESPNRSFDDVVRAPGADLGYFYDPTNGTVSRGDVMRSAKYVN